VKNYFSRWSFALRDLLLGLSLILVLVFVVFLVELQGLQLYVLGVALGNISDPNALKGQSPQGDLLQVEIWVGFLVDVVRDAVTAEIQLGLGGELLELILPAMQH
jgi:hypothetical protein